MTPSLQPTRIRDVLGAAGVALVAAWLGLSWWQGQGGSLPVVGVTAWLPVVLLAVAVTLLARRTRRTLARDRTRLDHEQAVRRAVLGKASLYAAALLGGGYLGLVVVAAPGWPAPLAVDRVVHGAIAVVAAAAWAVAGAVLERACRIPSDEDDTGVSSAG